MNVYVIAELLASKAHLRFMVLLAADALGKSQKLTECQIQGNIRHGNQLSRDAQMKIILIINIMVPEESWCVIGG